MSIHSPTARRPIRGTPAGESLGLGAPMSSTSVPEASGRPSRATAHDPDEVFSDSDLPIDQVQEPVARAPSRAASQSRSGSRQGARAPSELHQQAPYDGDQYFSGGSRRSQRPRFRDEADDEYYSEGWDPRNDRVNDRYWRDDNRRPRNHQRTGPHSRPPPAILNQRISNLNHDEYDDLVKGFNEDTRETRGSFDTPKRYRASDEEMGYQSESPSRPGATAAARAHGAERRIEWNDLTAKEKAEVMRLPWTRWMTSGFKNHFVATLGELVGTTMFLFFAFAGTEVANIQSNNNDNTTTGEVTGFDVSVLLYISLIFGFSLMVNVWIFFRISGGLFNPAVTVAMIMVKSMSITRGVCLFVAQMGGSMLASVIVRYLFPESFNVRTTLAEGTSLVQGIFIEAILTAELVFTIFMLAKEKHRATFIAPVGIGLALFIAEIVGVQFTGGSLNPARSFGPCAVTATFDEEHWIYWVGPFAGSLIAVVFYKFIKTLEYEMANPGADGDASNDPTKNPEKRAEIRMERHASNIPARDQNFGDP